MQEFGVNIAVLWILVANVGLLRERVLQEKVVILAIKLQDRELWQQMPVYFESMGDQKPW